MSDHVFAGTEHPVPAIHYDSHRSLLQPYRPARALRLDAIVVSAARPSENLRPALQLGAAIDVPVVLMCSHAARVDKAAAQAAAVPGASCVVVDISTAQDVGWPDFETSGFRQAQVGSHGDLSQKRNLGLLLGRLSKWRTVLFLDDDIAGLDPHQVSQAVSALDHHAAVGMPAHHFPDNSVVGHAHRLTGGRQDVFVSASALAVNMMRADSFFPDTYNEDWLFLAPYLDRREVAAYGFVQQQPYAPFEYPHRAGAQEFGDVLAEGLIGFLHSARLRRRPSGDYWTEFLERRAAFIARTIEGCLSAVARNAETTKAIAALEIAEQTRSKIAAGVLSEYVDAWLHDLEIWRQFLAKLPRLGRLSDALQFLHLSTVTVVHSVRHSSDGARGSPTALCRASIATQRGASDDVAASKSWRPDPPRGAA